VPAHNVAPYLETCLRSLAEQTIKEELDVIVVDDGSTDASGEIAERFSTADERFRLVSRENAGLGAARNTGIDQARGEFLAFVDADDAVPRHAYEMLVGTLDRTGSDFASGNVRRLTTFGTSQAAFVAQAFETTRLRTHVTRFPALLADRLAPNKLFRRSFWDQHGLRFPEGVLYEDIPAIVPAHYLADAVDVLKETVYFWRVRPGVDRSITQRRTETRAIRDRIAAVDYVSRFLAARGLDEDKRRYDVSVLVDDLRRYLIVLDRAEPVDRWLFFNLMNEFLDRAHPGVLDVPLAIDRLMWHLVRRRAVSELMEVLRFLDEDFAETPAVRKRRHWYGDYPYRLDRRLAIPARVYELDAELGLEARITCLLWEGTRLVVEGYAYIQQIGAPERGSQRLDVVLRRPGSRRRPLKLRTERVHRPDVTAAAKDVVGLDWSGFRAEFDVRRRRPRQAEDEYRFEIGIVVRAGGVTRRSWNPKPAPYHPLPPAETVIDDVRLQAGFSPSGKLVLRVPEVRATVSSYRFGDQGILQLQGDMGRVVDGTPSLSVTRRIGSARLEYPLHMCGETTFTAHVPLVDLAREVDITDRSSHAEQSEGIAWDLYVVSGAQRDRLRVGEAVEESTWTADRREITVHRTRYGNLTIVERVIRPIIASAEWRSGTLVLSGVFRAPHEEYELLLSERLGAERFVVSPLVRDGSGRFEAAFDPGSIRALSGSRELPAGEWELLVTATGGQREGTVAAVLDQDLLTRLPLRASVGHKTFQLGVLGLQTPILGVERDLDIAERGGYRQRLLRAFYTAGRTSVLKDVVLYESYGGRSYSDSPRAIHEELVRRDAPLEHRWVVRDGAFRVPKTALPVRELSRDYYDFLARARYVVTNDYWPKWAERRPDQIWVQTWHGLPVKRHGYQLADRPTAVRAYRQALRQRPGTWRFVVSPCSAATPFIDAAFPNATRILETGLPRTDLLTRSNGKEAAAAAKRRLGLNPEGRVVLYAPTYRDSLPYRHGYRLGPLLDLAAVRAKLGEEWTILFRKHRLILDALPEDVDDDVVDVTGFCDATELLQAVDVLVTDYSSLVADFACTGRPIIFYTPDLEDYRDRVRGLNVDLEAEAPGPLLQTTEEVAEAIADEDAIRVAFRERYEAFATRYCALSDGRAADRVIDTVFFGAAG
jgi:CDP-glycerol glycerophosphotransferase